MCTENKLSVVPIHSKRISYFKWIDIKITFLPFDKFFIDKLEQSFGTDFYNSYFMLIHTSILFSTLL